MTSDSGLFRTRYQLLADGAIPDGPNWVLPSGEVYVPLYDVKMVHQFDHSWAEYETDGKTTRVLQLTYTTHDLRTWAEDLGLRGEPFAWHPKAAASCALSWMRTTLAFTA